jgi:nucleotide-binding universal stress UspA family protein
MERVERDQRERLKAAEAEIEGVPVQSVVRFGEPVAEILSEVDAFGADLLAVAARGRRWLPPAVTGVAGKLLRRSDVPVLLLKTR